MGRKISIMNKKPEISDGEIESYMDFNKLLKQTAEQVSLRRNRLLKRFGLATLISAGLVSVWFFYRQQEKPAVSHPTVLQPQENSSLHSKGNLDSVSLSNEKSTDVEYDSAKESIQPITAQRIVQKPREKDTTSTIKKSSTSISNAEKGNADAVYAHAVPVDGYPALYAYFQESLQYPAQAVADSLEGVVTVVFTINTEGRPEKIYIDQSLGDPFDQEAIRVIENMPLWKPASYNGKSVPSKMSLPLTFQITKITTH